MGKIKFRNDDKYKGLFKDGRPSKYGEMRYQTSLEGMNGDLESGDYKGEWKGGKRHGEGVMKWDDGSVFEGTWSVD
jgi:1-phosphatidylinositol-4-phosphate 5-kinase